MIADTNQGTDTKTQEVATPPPNNPQAISLTPYQIQLIEQWAESHPGIRPPLITSERSSEVIWLNRKARRSQARFRRLALKHVNTDPSQAPPTMDQVIEAKVLGAERLSQREERILMQPRASNEVPGTVTSLYVEIEARRMARAVKANEDFVIAKAARDAKKAAQKLGSVAENDTQTPSSTNPSEL